MIGWPAALFLLLTGAVIPLLAWASQRALDGGLDLPRIPFYVESSVLQVVMLPFSIWVASRSGVRLPFDWPISGSDLLAGAGLLLVALVAMKISWPRMSEARRRRLEQIVPRSWPERLLWMVVSTTAAFNEEITYRGVLPALLALLTGDWWIAVVVSSIFFGLAHLVQGLTSSVIIMVFGFAFHLLVLFTGSLWIAIAIHFLYDLIAGYTLGRAEPRGDST